MRRSAALRYAFAISLACLAAGLHSGLDRLFGAVSDGDAYEFFLGATALSSIWAGRLSGLVTLGCSALIKLYFFTPPIGTFRLDFPAGVLRLLLFLGIGSLICLGGGALYASQETLDSALRGIGDAVVATDHRKLVRFMNPAAEDLSGWPMDDAVGRSVEDVLRVFDEKTLVRRPLPLEAVLRQGVVSHLGGGSLLVSKTGKRIPVEDTIAPIRGPSQQPRGAILVFRDVTEQRQAQNALQESESRYRFLAEAVPEFIFTANSRGFCDYWNQRWYDYTGFSPEQSRGTEWMDALHPDDMQQVGERWAESIQTGKPYDIEFRLRNREGKYRWFLTRGLPMRGEPGLIFRWLGICTDVEDFKRTQEQLHQALKMEAVGRLAGGVAHDFNNLLTVIIGYGQLLSDAAERSGAPSAQAQQILYAAERASELTRQLLTFSRRQIVQPRLLNLNDVLRETETMLRRLIGEDILVRAILGADPLPVRIDRGQIEQVIVNLAVNARDAMPNGGQLILETASVHLDEEYSQTHLGVEPGPYVMLRVSDTGQGMNPQTLAHLFEPFFTTKGPEKGTGLGLSTVYGIVKQSGGHISVYSEVGRGTTFTIHLPAVQEPGAESKPTTRADAQVQGTETILLLEDEGVVRNTVRAMLVQRGYTVLEADRPEEALRQCREYSGQIDLLLTDIVMPRMSGPQVAEQARQLRPTLKVLFMSGYTGDVLAHHQMVGSAAALLHKPFSSEVLLQSVRQVLGA